MRPLIRILSALLLVAGLCMADEAADRAAIERTIAAVGDPQVRADRQKMAALTTADFDGSLQFPPATFTGHSVEFVTPEIALTEGGPAQNMTWVMILKKEGSAWRIAAVRSAVSRPGPGSLPAAGGETAERAAVRHAVDTMSELRAPTGEIWCELDCVRFNTTRAIRFLAPGVALADGETRQE